MALVSLATHSVLIAVFLIACSAELPPPRPEPTLRTDVPAELADAIQLREAFGLRADPEYVAQVAEDPAATTAELGIPLLPAEAAEIRRRFAAQDRMGALTAYGAEHRDQFGGLYIDQQAGGTVVLLFTGDIAQHQRAVAALAPAGVRTVVRQVRHTEAELEALQQQLTREMDALQPRGVEFITSWTDVERNIVQLEAKSNDPTLEATLEAAHPGMVDVVIHPLPGPWRNAEAGEGWRLVTFGETDNGEAYNVRAAVDAASWETMWGEVGLGDAAPDIDWDSEVAVSFAYGIGSSCREIRLDDVVIDRTERLVHSVTSDPLAPRACTADLVAAHVFIVALDRSALPTSPFTVQLQEQTATCPDCGFQEQIEVSVPGS